MSNKMAGMKKATAVMLVVTVGIFQSLIASAVMAQVTPQLAGDLSVRGSVTLNGVNATNGATVFNGGRISTGDQGTAIISLGRLGQIELTEGSELVLKVEAGMIGGNLRTGRATVSAPAGIGVNVMTAEGVAVAEGKEATVLSVDVTCGNTRVTSSRNEAKVTSGNRVEIVAAGQEIAVGAQSGSAQRCPRMAAATARVGATTALGGTALAALLLIGIGGGIAGIIAATRNSNGTANLANLSRFRP